MTTQEHRIARTSVEEKGRYGERLLRLVGAAGGAALAGLLTALTMPHGPATSGQVWIVMLTSLAAGVAGGLVLRSRWALLLLPVVYIVAVELARGGVAGPTAGALRLDNPYGILALVTGRVFHGLVALLPLMLGAGVGAMIARLPATPDVTPLRAFWQQPLLVLLALPVLALAILNAIPARTPPVVDGEGRKIAGSIAELTRVPLGGQEQTIMIRAHSAELPVLLYLSGGPGQSDLPFTRVLLEDLTEHFVVVGWDQRGTGKSYAALDPTDDLTLEQAVADTIALTDYLRERFDEEKIYMLGESWGTTLGVLAVQQRPDLYHAWLGSGQMVSQRETDKLLYKAVVTMAAQRGDMDLTATMLSYGEPPYEDVPYPNAVVMSLYPQLETPYTPPQAYIERGTAANLGPYAIFGSEYNFVEKVNVLRGLIDMFSIMYPQIQEIDFRQDVPRLDVPVYILDGEAELAARRELALEWYEMLEAPVKRLYSFENGGHSVAFEQFEALEEILVGTVLPETYR